MILIKSHKETHVSTDSSRVISDFDPHFKVFHELMSFKVLEILLVSSPYDAYILEEDGSIATRLLEEYQGLNLSKAPRITRASNPEEAFELLPTKHFDLVITMPYLNGMNGFELGAKIKEFRPLLPVILVAHNTRATEPLNPDYAHGIDKAYLWCCEADLLLAIIKNIEDNFNVDADTDRAMVRVIIYVEDSPTYRSLFLPLIYQEVVRQTQSVLDESLNERHRLLRMRARPRILMAENYEDAIELFRKYRPFVFGIISDARFKKNGVLEPHAGVEFLQKVRKGEADIPALLISSEEENREEAEKVQAVFISKNSPTVRGEVRDFFLNCLGFGDFLFKLPDGTTVGKASNLYEFEKILKKIPIESVIHHLERNHLSNWVMARAEVILARRLHRDYFASLDNEEAVRGEIVKKVSHLRRTRQRGVVVNFSVHDYDPEVMDFVKIGNGSMGGKARGLAFMWACLQSVCRENPFLSPEMVTIPKTCVITADGFEAFISEQNLHYTRYMEDEKVADLFLDADLPDWLRHKLKTFLLQCNVPISVRSSSLLEDAQFKPYAGLYSTYFLPNNHEDFEERLGQLESAVKLVYASTWFESPQAFSKSSVLGRDDAMAVIIQQLVGAENDGYWYPAISGVGQSHNFYPVMNMEAEDGIAQIALGVGKTVVEGGKSLSFSPNQPKRLVQFSSVDDILVNSQRQFYALNMSSGTCLHRQMSNLELRTIQSAENEQPVKMLASTYVADEHRIRDASLPGMKVMTFAQLLKYSTFPLADILKELLAIGRAAMGCDVEIEFAVHLNEEDISKSVFYFLQIRPMITGGEQVDVMITDEEVADAFCVSHQSLGHGRFDTMQDILYVVPSLFDPAKTQTIAGEIGVIAKRLAAADNPFLLIGPGRWGSSDHWLGIPVQWSDIAGVGVIVEVQNDTIKAEPSQGSHFFQNITSLGIPYLTVKEHLVPHQGSDKQLEDKLNWSELEKFEVVEEGDFVRHVRLAKSFTVKCDGKKSRGVINLNT